MSIEKEFIPYQEALALKELGFDEPCFAYYDEEGDDQVYEYANCNHNVTGNKVCYNNDFQSVTNSQLNKYGAFCSKDEEDKESFSRWTAPTYSQAFRWFREKYKLQHHIWSGKINSIFYGYDIINIEEQEFVINNSENGGGDCDYETYEEAEVACLGKLIEIVQGGNK